LKSHLNEAVWWALKDAGIEISFPQLDVHFDKSSKPDDLGEVNDNDVMGQVLKE
jgi:small-conductance mechanosensitive channel